MSADRGRPEVLDVVEALEFDHKLKVARRILDTEIFAVTRPGTDVLVLLTDTGHSITVEAWDGAQLFETSSVPGLGCYTPEFVASLVVRYFEDLS